MALIVGVCALCMQPIIALAADDPEIVVIGEDSFRLSDLQSFVRARPSLQARLMSEAGIVSLVDEFIDSHVFRREGLARGLSLDPATDTTSDGYYFFVQNQLIPKCERPAEDAVRMQFESDTKRFATPPLVRTQRVFLPKSATIEGLGAQPYLTTAAEVLRRDGARFPDLLRVVQDWWFEHRPAEVPQLGDVGFVTLPPLSGGSSTLETELWKARTGEVIGPLEHEDYVFVIHVVDRREPVDARWPEVRAEVEREMLAECRSNALRTTRAALYQRHGVSIRWDNVRQLAPHGQVRTR